MIFGDALDLARPALGKKLLQLNWPFVLLITAITGIGVAALYSVAGGSLDPWASRHVVRYCIGLGILFAVVLIDIKLLIRCLQQCPSGVSRVAARNAGSALARRASSPRN
jgi:cell division protein FtsW (lipid II flippase)